MHEHRFGSAGRRVTATGHGAGCRPGLSRKARMWRRQWARLGLPNRSLGDRRPGKITEFGRMVIPALGCDDVDVVTAGFRHSTGRSERSLDRFAAMGEFSVLAHGFDGESHFFFFFFFFLRTVACALKASASVFIWSATKASAAWAATRSAASACFRMAFGMPIML
jgi:hypothetical protein